MRLGRGIEGAGSGTIVGTKNYMEECVDGEGGKVMEEEERNRGKKESFRRVLRESGGGEVGLLCEMDQGKEELPV